MKANHYKIIFSIALFIALAFTSITNKAATFNSVVGGDWVNDATWSSAPSTNDCASAGNHTFNISHAVTSTCNPLNFSGNVTIRILSGGSFTITGSGGITGSVTLIVDAGGSLAVSGNLNLSGSSAVDINGTLTVGGNVVGVGSIFDCNGTSGTGTVTISGTGCTNCTSGSSGSCSTPLPVQFVSFNASYLGVGENSVSINWETTEEINSKNFIVEKSYDGISFKAIADLKSTGTATSINNYTFIDNAIKNSSIIYYRLKQIDNDGNFTFSEIKAVSISSNNFDLRIFPNPSSSSDFNLTFNGGFRSALLVVYDIHGVQLFSKTITYEENNIVTAKDLNTNLLPGIYYIHASSEGELINKKLIIQ